MIKTYSQLAYYQPEGSSKMVEFKICIVVHYVDKKILRYTFLKYGGGGGVKFVVEAEPKSIPLISV